MLLTECALIVASIALIVQTDASTQVAIDTSPNVREVRYTSGQGVYLEGLEDGKWLSRYWSADGRINWLYEKWSQDAFNIEIDKSAITSGWNLVSASELPNTENGSRHCVVDLENSSRAVNVRVHTLLDGTPIMVRWLEITNTSEKPVALTGLSVMSGRAVAHSGYGAPANHTFRLGVFTRFDWAWEGWFDWLPLTAGTKKVSCDKGQGHGAPFFVLEDRTAGQYVIGHMAWSANWKMEFTRTDDGPDSVVTYEIGPEAVDALRTISPGETITTPALHLGCVLGDFDTTVQAMHNHLRCSVIPQRKPEQRCLIQYSVPGDQGFLRLPEGGCGMFTEKAVKENIDLAAAIGCEVFILDYGWTDVVCDWEPSPTRFPHGIKALRDYAHKKGLLFGLYAETEGGRGSVEKSPVAKDHPDWILPKSIVNLAIPEAAAWVESETCRMIEEYDLDMLRLDYNPIFTMQGSSFVRDGILENNYWRYYEAFYSMYDRLRKKYPDVIFQQCAAGGARNDIGTSGLFHESYLTDGLSMPHVLQCYSGQTVGLPPEILLIAIGADGGPTNGRLYNLDSILRVTYGVSTPFVFGGMVAPNVSELSSDRKDKFLHYAKLYKEFIRPILPECIMYHHAPVDVRGGVESQGWFVVEFASPDKKKGWAVVVRIGESDSDTYRFKPRGLNCGETYDVTFDSKNESVTTDGMSLLGEGIPVRLEQRGTSELLLFTAK